MRQAYVDGHLDPSTARPFDRMWWLKVRYTLDWLETKNRNEVRKLKHDLNCALLDYNASQKAIELHWDQANFMQRLIHKSTMPWRYFEGGKLSRGQLRELKALWELQWGKMDSPATQEAIERTVKHLMNIAGRGRR